MIRRTFWLTVGAAGGIMGYRRVASLGQRAARRGWARRAVLAGRDARGFTRDVRAGMDLYIARHPGRETPTLPASEGTNVKDGR